MREMVGLEGEKRLSKIGMEKMMVSMGHQASGAMALWNYPSWMRNLVAHDVNGEDRHDLVDMAALESTIQLPLELFGFILYVDRSNLI